VNQRTASSPVAIGERMECLQLGVDQTDLDDRWKVGVARIEAVPAEPVLRGSDDSTQFRARRPVHECAMQRSDLIGIRFSHLGNVVDSHTHRLNAVSRS
jgi:hypothetical protein